MAALAAPAGAAGYDDFTRGLTANLRGESDVAIAAFTMALSATDLPAVYRPVAYRGRATAYLEKDMCAQAAGDLAIYATLQADQNEIRYRRVWTDLCTHNLASAQKGFEALTGPSPGFWPYYSFGRLLWRYGYFAEAARTMQLAYQVSSKKKSTYAPYNLLWYALTSQRAGTFDKAILESEYEEISNGHWPAPIMDLYLSKTTPDSVLKDASDEWHPLQGHGKTCEANFFIAEWYIAHNNIDAALPLLRAAVERCPRDFDERPTAIQELMRQEKKS